MPLFQGHRHQAETNTCQRISEMAQTVSTRIKVVPKMFMVTFCFLQIQVTKLEEKCKVKIVLLSLSSQTKDLLEAIKILI